MIRFKKVKEGENENKSNVLHRQKQTYYIETKKVKSRNKDKY
jgi:hypothetical protein